MPGLVSSCRQKLNTVNVDVQVEMLPEVSVAVQVTVVVPTGNGEPEGGLQENDCRPQLSVALAVKLTVALVAMGHEAVAAVAMFGQVTVGGVLSITVTANGQLAPPGSEQLTKVVPTGKQDPEGGLQVTVPQPPEVVGAG